MFAATTGRTHLLGLGFVVASTVMPGYAQTQARTLDDFERATDWTVVASNQVGGKLRSIAGADGRALCLDYDFNGVSGYVGLQREMPIEYPADYAFAFQLRGDSPANDLQFKLVDASGDNVWWVNKPRYAYPEQWTPVVYKRRHISRAWGPAPDPTLRRSQKLEFTVYNSAGGKGSVCFDSLTFEPRVPDDGSSLAATASSAPGSDPAHAVDGDPATAWNGRFLGAATDPLLLDLGHVREFGGLTVQWADSFVSDYAIALSGDGRQWREVRRLRGGNGGRDWIALPESEARYIRLVPLAGPSERFGLAQVTIEPLAFAATPNDLVKSVAAQAPRGHYPRGFIGEQPYWTIVGIDGGDDQGLIGEDGAVEVARGGFSIEPFVVSGGKLVTWADVKASQSLQDDYLPIPSVAWEHPDFALAITAFAEGTRERSQLSARYTLTNTTDAPRDYTLALAVRPLQVNPPTQFLSTIGGVSAIGTLGFVAAAATAEAQGGRWEVNGTPAVALSQRPTGAFASSFDGGPVVDHLAAGAQPRTARVIDPTGLASGATLYAVRLAPGESYAIDWRAPLTGGLAAPEVFTGDAETRQQQVAAQWRDKLDQVKLRVPSQGQKVVDTLRTGLAHMLISRKGPRLQPGTRSYARAWIRDGAMIAEGLLRMGRAEVAEEFLRWYAPYQFDDGKVPCCVDDRGSDPVPENDSHGELIFAIAEVYRYTRDRQLLDDMWPHVVGAVKYMDELRLSERTEANRAANPAFYGMMPASISHEGYSAKPMHSYWDNFWALRGYKDAALIARWLGRDAEAGRFAASRDQFRADLYASIAAATKGHDIDYIPGAAELGDFDATSTTIALAPGSEQGLLPQDLLHNTFERYWREFVARRDGSRQWKDYTPYELRTIGSFVRLGWRDRAHEALAFFFADQQPRGWNQWAEVVSRTPRQPFFVGDLPHAWVESDYVRSTLDMFAYVREGSGSEVDEALVIGAGIPADWLDGAGVTVDGLRTPYGVLGFSLRRDKSGVRLRLSPGLRLPPGGVVLQLPAASMVGLARIAGAVMPDNVGELRIDRVPADVVVEDW